MRLTFFAVFIFCLSIVQGQSRHVRYYYSNGHILSKGKIVICDGYQEKYPCFDSTCRKTGKWIYYFQNGIIQRKETYRKIHNCNTGNIKEGWWEYYNENKELIKKEEYKNNHLWTSDIADYFLKNELAGKVIVRNGIWDTVIFIKSKETANLIKNGDFTYYLGPPQMITSNGQSPIENQIPFWFSPDKHTPDYYNPLRRLKNVPDNMNLKSDSSNYIGLILYHQPTGTYSEYITGELVSGLKANYRYCLNISIRLSQNSGFFLNRIGINFSVDKPEITPEKSSAAPQIIFSSLLYNTSEWKTLCTSFTASGNEKYVTLGRFADLDETTIFPTVPVNRSEGEYNESAYYLINKIELIEDISGCNCDMSDTIKEERTIME